MRDFARDRKDSVVSGEEFTVHRQFDIIFVRSYLLQALIIVKNYGQRVCIAVGKSVITVGSLKWMSELQVVVAFLLACL